MKFLIASSLVLTNALSVQDNADPGPDFERIPDDSAAIQELDTKDSDWERVPDDSDALQTGSLLEEADQEGQLGEPL